MTRIITKKQISIIDHNDHNYYGILPGSFVESPNYKLSCKKFLHVCGPTKEDDHLLSAIYEQCLNYCFNHNYHSIIFPCISTGVYRFPNDLAAKIATEAVDEVLNQNGDKFDKIIFDVYSDQDLKYYERYISE